MEGRFLLVAAGVVLGCAIALPAHAYDDTKTHPALTDEIVTLHNRLYPQDQVSDEERRLLMQGSTEEDILPRPLNHLYDPVHHVGWTGIKTGWVPAVLARITAIVGLLPDEPLANVEWIGADSEQQAYARYGGNRSWPAAVRAAASGDYATAYRDLGSALHLLEDAGVPDHARDDTHVHEMSYLTGDAGSPYEAYAKRYGPGSVGIASRMSVTTAKVPRFGAPRDYLEDNARFAADSFFSKDTVQDKRFEKPRVIREKDGIAYGLTRDGREVPLARRVSSVLAFVGATSSLKLGTSAEFDVIYEAQFRVMAERTILLGVGMIRDFKDAEKKTSSQPAPTRLIVSLAGEANRALNTVAGWFGGAASAVTEQVTRAYAWVTGAFTSVASGNPSQVAQQQAPASSVGEIAAKPAAKSTAAKKTTTAKTTKASVKTTAAKATATSAVKAVEVANCPASGPEDVIVSELAWMGTAASANDEWIELANREAEAVSLQGWELASADGTLYIDLDAVTIPARGFVLLERTDDSSVPTIMAKAIYTGALANAPADGYALELRAAGCGTVDRVDTDGGWSAGDAASRRTMERVGASWQTSALPGGTPGRANSAGFVKPAATSTKQATTTTKQTVEDEDDIEEVQDEQEEEPFVIDMGRVVLSEIQAAGQDVGDEFVELYNPESRSVSLEGWSLQYFAATQTADAQKRDLPKINIPARGFVLIGREKVDGADGYHGSVAADYAHRSFTLSGAGATVALVRGSNKVASTSDAAVGDWIRYPKLLAHESYERAAAGVPCLDPRAGMSGEYQGNGCLLTTWYLRSVAEPQNRASLPEPREGTPPFQATTTTSTDPNHPVSTAPVSWIALPGTGYEAGEPGASWKAFALLRGDGVPPTELTTETQLVPVGIETLSFEYLACNGSRVIRKILILPLTPTSCQTGGPLSSAFRGSFWEDGMLMARLIEKAVPGEFLHLLEYAFSGAGGGIQRFTYMGSSTIEVAGNEGETPTAPSAITFVTDNLPMVRITWQSAQDLDNVDADLSYEVRVAENSQAGVWETAGMTLFLDKELMPNTYTISVRAVDEQGHRGPEASMILEIAEPVRSEQFVHDEEFAPGGGTLRIAETVTLSGLAVWLVPEAGQLCCSFPEMSVLDPQGNIIARGSTSRRMVDGEGDTPFSFESPITLVPGTYRLEITRPETPGNNFGLRGKGSEGDWNGSGSLYLRFVR